MTNIQNKNSKISDLSPVFCKTCEGTNRVSEQVKYLRIVLRGRKWNTEFAI